MKESELSISVTISIENNSNKRIHPRSTSTPTPTTAPTPTIHIITYISFNKIRTTSVLIKNSKMLLLFQILKKNHITHDMNVMLI